MIRPKETDYQALVKSCELLIKLLQTKIQGIDKQVQAIKARKGNQEQQGRDMVKLADLQILRLKTSANIAVKKETLAELKNRAIHQEQFIVKHLTEAKKQINNIITQLQKTQATGTRAEIKKLLLTEAENIPELNTYDLVMFYLKIKNFLA